MKLIKKEKISQQFDRWDISVSGYHNFVAEGIVVHNSLIGLVLNQNEGEKNREFIISSHKHQRKIGEGGNYEVPIHLYRLEEMAEFIYSKYFGENPQTFQSVLIYGEVIGTQDLRYGLKNGQMDYRCFDISINGNYISYDEMIEYCDLFEVKTCPLVYRGPFDEKLILELAEQDTLMPVDKPQLSEGLVVRPEIGRIHPKIGRVILKFVSNRYWTRGGNKTEYH